MREDILYIMVVGSVASSSAYCEEMVGGVFTIGDYRCETLLSEAYSERVTDVNFKKLRITLSNKGKVIATRTVCQINFPNWTDDVWPTTYDTLYDIHNLVTSSPKPIIVHSTTATGPAMGFVGLAFCSQLMEIKEEYTFDVVFRKLIKRRYCSFNDAQCIGWLEIGVMYFLTRKHRLEPFMFNNNNQMFQNMVTNGDGIPEELRGTRWD
ncbi:hypothetical protein GCK72_003072 [Caenorhabditis remanei]|uniref:Tyrosine-protein phosphatase domain-containing protein n=1 Tax=Caenorhabditis remanei TaxID=31234 RepID=A0A6A5HWI2_CAERE|nr:hypothetical protein GCK72_003072 [Caenorhabditis remanei]KAF1771246.1 hypothetical protein GCK72_003072 [Caenorhabditis remanei]